MLLSWHIGEAVQHTALSRQHSRVRIPYMSLSGEWGRNTEMSCHAAFFFCLPGDLFRFLMRPLMFMRLR